MSFKGQLLPVTGLANWIGVIIVIAVFIIVIYYLGKRRKR
jgi:LPXTG-motif cell wall-anchored protein